MFPNHSFADSVKREEVWNLPQWQSARRLRYGKIKHFKNRCGNKVLLRHFATPRPWTQALFAVVRDVISVLPLLNATTPGSLITQQSFSQTGSGNHQLILKGLRTVRTLRGTLILVSAGQNSHLLPLEHQRIYSNNSSNEERSVLHTRNRNAPRRFRM